MTTSTPPAWKWLDECDVPIQIYQRMTQETPGDAELSIDARNLPVSATLRARNDSDQCPDCRCAPNTPHATGCGWPTHLTDSVSNAAHEHPERDVSQTGNTPATGNIAHVESCPECGTVTDIEYRALGAFYDSAGVDMNEEPAVETHERVQGKDPDRMMDTLGTLSIPFWAQSWTFEALIEREVDHLHEIIDDHHDEIVKMARRRHEKGFIDYGSKGYSWDAETRLRNVLEELSDGGTYLTMGSIE